MTGANRLDVCHHQRLAGVMAGLALVNLTGCADNPVGRFLGNVGACIAGNPYRFAPSGSPTIQVLQHEGQYPLVTAAIPLEVGRPCEALNGSSSNIQSVRLLRNGTPVNATGGYDLGTYVLRFSEQVMPGHYRYEIQGVTDTSANPGILGRTSFDLDSASSIQGFPRLSVSNPTLPNARLTWSPTAGHGGYRLRFTYTDAAGLPQTVTMHLSPEQQSYTLGAPVPGDPVIEEGRTIGLPAVIADARGAGLRPGLKLTVTAGGFRFQPGTSGDRLLTGTDWEHRSLPIQLSP